MEGGDCPQDKNFYVEGFVSCSGGGENLLARGMKVDARCQRCGFEGESINHVLFTCPAARRIWAQVGFLFLEGVSKT